MRRPGLLRLRRWASGPPVAWAAFGFGLGLTSLVVWRLEHQGRQRLRAAFDAEVARLDQTTLRRVEAEVDLLRAAQGLFDAGPVDEQAWKAFVARFDLRSRYPGIRSLGFLARVSERDFQAYEHQRREVLGPALRLEPPASGWGFYPHFIEPMVRVPLRDMAWNIYKEPLRRSTLRRAIETDQPTVTPMVHLVGLDDPTDRFRPAVVVYLPVFQTAGTPSPAERWERCRGVVFASVVLHQVFEPLLEPYPHVALRVQDVEGGQELFRRGDFAEGRGRLERSLTHGVAGRTWRFTYRVEDASALVTWRREVWLFAFFGGLGSCGLGIFTGMLLAGKRKAERLALDLRRSERNFRRLTEQAPCGILQFDRDVITYANPFAREWLGLDPAFKSWRELVHPEDLPELEWKLWERPVVPEDDEGDVALDNDEVIVPTQVLELRLQSRVGPRWVALTLGGATGRGLATFFDLTGRVTAEGERLDAERRRAEARRLESLNALAAGLAHDFNNLLGIIQGRSELAGGTVDPHIQEACLRATDLTRQLLAFAGRGTLALRSIDLGALVKRFVDERVGTLPRGLVVTTEVLPAGRIQGQVEALEGVFKELWENAVEALGTEAGALRWHVGPVTLNEEDLKGYRHAEHLIPGAYVRVVIEDTGPGIPPQHLDRIFDPFFSTKFLGRGLGLASVAGVMKAHGGGIRVESEAGRGTRIELVFPVHGDDPAEETLSGLPQARQGRTVLVVDDEPILRELAAEALTQAGFQVLEAPGGRRALELLEQREDIGLLVLDMAMPDLNGAEVLRAIRGHYPGLRVILSSGYTEDHLRESLEPGDVAAFLPKPYRIARLQELARSLLGGEPDRRG